MPEINLPNISITECPHGCLIKLVGGKLTSFPLENSHDNAYWMLFCGFYAVSMQMGFAMLQVGSVRKVHRASTLSKNVLDAAVSAIAFWVYCESSVSKLVSDSSGRFQIRRMFFNWTLCSIAVTICSGSMAERAHLNVYLVFGILMSSLIYPQIAAGAWANDGLLAAEFNRRFSDGYSYYDCAGGGVVHLLGGCSALMGNVFLGRRILKFNPDDQSSTLESENPSPSPSNPDTETRAASQQALNLPDLGATCSMPPKWHRRFDSEDRDRSEFGTLHYLQVMGMFPLWAGWLAINAGNAPMDHGAAPVMKTTLAAAAGGLGSYVFCFLFRPQLDVSVICNGVITGLAAISSSCYLATKRDSVLIGFIAGLVVYPSLSRVVKDLRLDDAVDAVAVHVGGGLVGVLLVALVSPDCLEIARATGPSPENHFCEEDYQGGKQLIAQAWGAFTIIWWTVSISGLVFAGFAVSECTIALECGYLEKVRSILMNMVLLKASDNADRQLAINEKVKKLAICARQSDLATNILKEHGWVGDHFKHPQLSEPIYLLQICRRIMHEQKATRTALEVANWKSFHRLAQLLRSFSVHKFLTLRLRITPAAELSGSGVTDVEGSSMLLGMLQRVITKSGKEASAAHSSSNKALTRELVHLHSLVHGQEVLMRKLSAEQRGPKTAASSHHVERGSGSPYGSHASSSGSLGTPHASSRVFLLETTPSSTPPAQRPPSGARSTHTHSSGSSKTVSERGFGAVTPHSAGSFTPPPSNMNMFFPPPRPAARPTRMPHADHTALVERLALVLGEQQLVLANMSDSSPSGPGVIGYGEP